MDKVARNRSLGQKCSEILVDKQWKEQAKINGHKLLKSLGDTTNSVFFMEGGDPSVECE